MEIPFAGVKNTSGDVVRGTHGGVQYVFEKDEIAVVKADRAQFLLERNIISSDGKVTTRKFLFQTVALTEALKHVKEPENASIAEAKRASAARDAQKEELKAEIIAEIRAAGLHAAADRVSGKK